MIKLKSLLKEKEDSWLYRHGFDLTDFKPGGFQKVLTGLGLSVSPGKLMGTGDDAWVWSGPNIRIITANDPITGKHCHYGNRENEKNYASYMGLEGSAEKVALAVKLIKQNADEIKGESPGEREYI